MKRFGEGRGVNPFGFVMDWWRRHLHMITLMQDMIKSILMLCLALVDSLLVADDCGLMLVSSVAALALAFGFWLGAWLFWLLWRATA